MGESSPQARLYDLDGWVLLLGVTHANNTSLHLSEYRAEYPDKPWTTAASPVMVDGQRQWVTYDDLEEGSDDFEAIGEAFAETGLETRGRVGAGIARLCRVRDVVDFGVKWMEENRKAASWRGETAAMERVDVIVIGAGFAGLTAARRVPRQSVSFWPAEPRPETHTRRLLGWARSGRLLAVIVESNRRERAAGLGERHPIALIVIGVLVFSTGPVMVQWSTLSGPLLSFWRLWIGVLGTGVLTAVHVRVSGRWPSREGWTWAAWAGFAFGIHQLMFMTAVKATSVVDVTLMQVLAPILVAVIAVPLFDERPGARFRIWSIVAVAGAAGVALAGSSGPKGDPAGMALAAANVVMYAIFFVISKRARDHIDVVPFLFGVMTVAAVTVSAFCLANGEAIGATERGQLLIPLVMAAVPGGIGHFVSTWPLRWVPANIPPLLQLAIPFLAGAMAWVLLDERITAMHVISGALTIIGVAGAIRSPGGRRLVRDQEAALAAGEA